MQVDRDWAGYVRCFLAGWLFLIFPPAGMARSLNEKVDTPRSYRIHYWNNDSSDTNWFVSDDSAEAIASHFDRDGTHSDGNPPGAHAGYTNLGFRTPFFKAEDGVDRDIRCEKDTNPNANTDRIIMPPWLILSQGAGSTAMRQIAIHELFHSVQFAYTGNSEYLSSLSPFCVEGMATLAMDLLFDEDDRASWFSGWAYMAWAMSYLSEDYDETIFVNSDEGRDGYFSAVFWRYLADQYGSDRTEPHTGHDILERFWEKAAAKDDGRYTLLTDVLAEKDRYTTVANDPGTSLEKSFQDFSVACWLRRYKNGYAPMFDITVPDPGRFYFLDEVTGYTNFYGGDHSARDGFPDDDFPLADVAIWLTPESNSALLRRDVNVWASSYLSCSLSTSTNLLDQYGIGFWVESDPVDKCWYSLAGVRKNGEVDFVAQSTVEPEAGNQFHYALMQDATNPYVKLIAIVNGYVGGDSYGYLAVNPAFTGFFSYFKPTLQIKEPSATYPAYVGDHAAPDRFTVKLKVTSPDYLGSGSLKGLRPEQFKVFVGPASFATNEARVLSAADVFGEYWLTVQAPVKPSLPPSALTLTVRLGAVQVSIENVVLYQKLDVDQMLVIDRSGSMTKTSGGISRNAASRAAAQLFVESTGTDDQLGIVRFNGDESVEPVTTPDPYDDADVIWPLVKMSNSVVRALAQYLVDESNPGDPLFPDGYTSIGDGMYWGVKELIDRGRPGAEKWIILLSDGHQNEATDYTVHQSLLSATGVRVHSVALGPNCDEGLLQAIATRSGGRFYKVEADEDVAERGVAAISAYPEGNMMFSLADAYLSIHEDIKRKSRLLESTVTVPAGGFETVTLALDEGGLQNALITAFFPESGADIGLSVIDPSGATLPVPASPTNYVPEYHVAYRLNAMPKGTWQFVITNSESASKQVMLTVSAYNRQGARAELYFTQYHGISNTYLLNGYYLVGLPMPIAVNLTDAQGAILGADVTATISHPLKPDTVIRLTDDGNGFDSTANDGVYAGVYRATTEGSLTGGNFAEDALLSPLQGSYRVVAVASGTDHFGESFERIQRGSFQVYRQEQIDEDSDDDGMVDRYEDQQPCLDKLVDDDTLDADGDGVINGDEYRAGTLPCLSDTDGGGENDGSEMARGGNPLDHTDDLLTPMVFGHVLTQPLDANVGLALLRTNRNVVVTSFERGTDNIHLFRSLNPTSGYTHVTTIPRSSDGVYLDDGLTNGVTYYYRLLPVTDGGQTGVMSHVFSGTPKADPYPPSVAVSLPDHGQTLTNHIMVTLVASEDVVQMRHDFKPDMSPLLWQPYTNRFNLMLGPVSAGQTIPLYVQVRDAAGNLGYGWQMIHIVDTNTHGAAAGVVTTPLDYSSRALEIRWISTNTTHWGTTMDDGSFMHALPSGTYDLIMSMRGYASIHVTGIVVQAGAITNVGSFVMSATDADGDSLPDVHELRDYGTDRYQMDTDGDGHDDSVEVLRTRTNPTNSASVLRMLEPLTGSPVTVRWASVSGVVYEVDSRDVMVDATNWNYRATITGHAVHAESSFVDPAAMPATSRFYRVKLP